MPMIPMEVKASVRKRKMPHNHKWLMLAIAAAVLALPLRVSAYSSGAPPESCYSMSPIHTDPLTETVVPSIPCGNNSNCDGLTLTVTRNGESDGYYSCNEYHQVTLHSTRMFTGFFIQARVPVPGIPFHMYHIVGTFVSASPEVRTLQCNATVDSPTDIPQQNNATVDSPTDIPQQNSATNSASTPLHNVTVNWRAPEPFTALGNVQFYATVIENLTQSYLLVRSEELTLLNSTCEEYLPYLHLGTTQGVKTEDILREDDWSSDVIVIPGGFPFGTYNQTIVYIGTNGVFSFGYRELSYKFYLSHFERFTADPFWGDVDISNGVGEIKYEIHQSPSVLINQVSTFVSVRKGLPFVGTWMMVCYWKNVPEYDGSLSILNTFQGIIVTDGYRSFMVNIFKNGDIGWYDPGEVRIGYYADSSFQMFGPQDEVSFFKIQSNSSSVPYYSEIYQLSIDGQEVVLVKPELVGTDITITSTSTTVTLEFDLAVNALSCDASHFSLQTLDGRVTFTPMHAATCAQVTYNYYHHEDNGDHIMTLTFHNADHLRLLGKPYNEILQNNVVAINIHADFVYTAANISILPKFFIDGSTASIQQGTFITPTILSISLDLSRAEFRMKMNVPVNITDLDNITLSCGQSETVILEGILSTPDADHITQDILLHLSSYTFAALCCTLPCVEDGTAFLESFTTFRDAFGNSINPNNYIFSRFSVSGSFNCHLGVQGQEFALLDESEQGPDLLGLYLSIQIPSLQCNVVYPLQNHEVYLQQCHPTVEVNSVSCLRLKNVSNPQLQFTATDETLNVPTIESNGVNISTAYLNSSGIFGVFTCHSNEGYTVESIIAYGETYFSPIIPTHSETVSIPLGSYLELNFTIATCPTLDPKDIVVASSSMREPSVTNNNQNVHVQLGPLGSDDEGNVSILVPTREQGYTEYNSVFNIEIEVPQVQAYITGSPQLTTIVRVEGRFLTTTLHCEPNINAPVIWFEKKQGQPITEITSTNNFLLERSGYTLSILNYDVAVNATLSFSCHLTNPSYNSPSVSVATFTIATIPDVITISNDTFVLSGAVSSSYPHHTVFSKGASEENLVLPCLSGTGYGSLRWLSTIPQFAGLLGEDSTSPDYSVTYSGSIATLTVHNYTLFSGSLTCYSEEAGLMNESVSVHISDDICMCYGSYSSPYPLSDCGGSIPPCTCPSPYVGDGVLCALDSDNDGYPNVATLPSCDIDNNDTFCKLDICPAFFNPDQSFITLEDIDETTQSGVAYVFEETLLPDSVVVSTDDGINLNLSCIGATGNTDITVNVFEVGPTNTSSYTFYWQTCETEARISLSLSRGFQGAIKCQADTTGNIAWIYFSTDACLCTTASVNTSVLPNFVHTCEKAGKACDCTNSQCMCACGRIGDGVVCSTDSDGDTYPYPTISPLCAGGGTHTYCTLDNCHMDYNPEQDPKTCEALEDSETNICHAERDLYWGIIWSDTYVGLYDTQSCSSGNSSLGAANRLCFNNGTWSSEISTTCCSTVVFDDLLEDVNEILAEEITNETQSQVKEIITSLVEATTPPQDQSSLYPQDLGTTNEIVEDTINVLLQAVQADLLDKLNTEIVQVMDNVLEESNTEGWIQLDETTDGAENLLSNAELYGTYIVESIASSTVDVDLQDGELTLNASFNNIFINAVVQDTTNVNDVVFPVAKENFTLEPQFGTPMANIRIPADLLKERAGSSSASDVFTVNMVIENINKFLSTYAEVQETNGTVRAVTQLVISQIKTKNGTEGQEETRGTFGTPAQLVFVTEELANAERPRCAFWNFTESQWSEAGISTDNVTKSANGKSYHVVCSTEHLTSFAVLVDVAETQDQPNEIEAFALSIVSYAGCGISVCCLLLSIIFFLSYGKKLFTNVHYFVHLNLAVALFLGYIAFAAGITTATQYRIACGIVAGLLHYLFLMVFSKVSKQWWLFLLIGWGLPVIVVGISVGAAHDQYGDPDNGYCWISVHQGAIWAFVAPMLAVISVNIFFFFATLRALYKVSAGKYKQEQGNWFVVRKLLIAAVILLPILGLTWVFGLLAVNENTTVFAWIFTILNSLQGMFFFIFHVVRSDKVWKTLKKYFPVRSPMKRRSSEKSKDTQTLVPSSQGSSMKRSQKKPRRSGKKHKKENLCALSSDAVIVLENPLYDHPFGKKKDSDLRLSTTVIV